MRQTPQTPGCLALTGPTATGKTEIALALAREWPLEIVSMDSAMVYRGMDIGTAKPAPDVLAAVPHHLIDIRDPEESYSAGRFAADAARLVAEIAGRGRIALVVGGTMLYLKALRQGIAALPERDPGLRAAIDARAGMIGWPALHEELARVDPEAAARIEPTDRQRIQRALEVFEATGRPISAWQRVPAAAGLAVDCIALIPPDRAALGEIIERRFHGMVQRGLVEEVRRLRERPGLRADAPSMRAVGYRQIWAHLEGELTWAEAERRAVTATRQLAKRQLTWLRGDSLSARIESDDPGLTEILRKRLESLQKGP